MWQQRMFSRTSEWFILQIREAHPGAVRSGVRLFCGKEGGGIVL